MQVLHMLNKRQREADSAQIYAPSPGSGVVWTVDPVTRSIMKTPRIGGIRRHAAFKEGTPEPLSRTHLGFVSVTQ